MVSTYCRTQLWKFIRTQIALMLFASPTVVAEGFVDVVTAYRTGDCQTIFRRFGPRVIIRPCAA